MLSLKVWVPGDILMAIDAVVSDHRTDENDRSTFVRHAIWEYLKVWQEHGLSNDYVADILDHIWTEKLNAKRLADVQNFTITHFPPQEQCLADGAAAGAWDMVLRTLSRLEEYISRIDEVFYRGKVQKTIAQSVVVQHTISQLYDAAQEIPSLRENAEYWQKWLEELTCYEES
jgi:uncharacterized protein Usg